MRGLFLWIVLGATLILCSCKGDSRPELVERQRQLSDTVRLVWYEEPDQALASFSVEMDPDPVSVMGYSGDFIALSAVVRPFPNGIAFEHDAFLEFDLSAKIPLIDDIWLDRVVLRDSSAGNQNYIAGSWTDRRHVRFQVRHLAFWVVGWPRDAEGIWDMVSGHCHSVDDPWCQLLRTETCGDGIVQEPAEECESDKPCSGGCYSGIKTCLTNCLLDWTCDTGGQGCGNGIREGCELCDDGERNGIGEDVCQPYCTGIQRCGNGRLEGYEQCDEGTLNGTCGHCDASCEGWSACPDNPVKSIWSGMGRVCLIREDSTLECAGPNGGGIATPVEGEFASVAFSNNSTCALDDEGRAHCWGWPVGVDAEDRFLSLTGGYYGFCGLRLDQSLVCTEAGFGPHIPPPGKFAEVSMNSDETYFCAIRLNGALVCWGADSEVNGPPPEGEFVALSLEGRHACALRADGEVKCWGADRPEALAVPPGRYLSVQSRYYGGCGLLDDARIRCWGYGLDPSPIHEGPFVPTGGNTAVCAARADGTGWCLHSDYDQTYGGNWNSVPNGLQQIVGNQDNFCFLNENGHVSCWNSSFSNFTGFPAGMPYQRLSTPVPACGLKENGEVECWMHYGLRSEPGPFLDVSSDGNRACGVRTDHGLVCWTLYSEILPEPPEGRYQQVEVSGGLICAIKDDGEVICWDDAGNSVPSGLSGPVVQISLGSYSYYVCGLHSNGSVDCHTIYPDSRQDASYPGPFVSISGSHPNLCALKADGSGACWSPNLDNLKDYPGPFKALHALENSTCAIRTDGTLTCWGGMVR